MADVWVLIPTVALSVLLALWAWVIGPARERRAELSEEQRDAESRLRTVVEGFDDSFHCRK